MHGVYLAFSGLSPGDLKRRHDQRWPFFFFFSSSRESVRNRQERERHTRIVIMIEKKIEYNNRGFNGGWTVEGPGWLEDGRGTRTMDGSLFSTSLLPLVVFQMV